MRIEFTSKVRSTLFQKYTLLDDRSHLGEPLLNEILETCSSFISKCEQWTPEEIQSFEAYMEIISQQQLDQAHSRIQEVEVDLLYWYQVQNIFNGYFCSVQDSSKVSTFVLRALDQILESSINTDYFALMDCLMELMVNLQNEKNKSSETSCLLVQIYEIQYILGSSLQLQKKTLKFLDKFELNQNLKLKKLELTLDEIHTKRLEQFQQRLQLLSEKAGQISSLDNIDTSNQTRQDNPSKSEIEIELVIFKCLISERLYGKPHNPDDFFEKVNAINTVKNLIKIISNESGNQDLIHQLHCIEILNGLIQLDLLKEFKYLAEKRNPFFKEACRYFNFFAQTLVKITQKLHKLEVSDDMQVDQSYDTENNKHLSSQRYLFQMLLLVQSLIEIRTKEMSQSFYPQLFEPLVEIVSILPKDGKYLVNLGCQELAVQMLKDLTKKSYIFDDSSLLLLIIDRLKVEFQILEQSMENPEGATFWRPNLQTDDMRLLWTSLKHRQKFVTSTLSFLCYSIIRMDPNSLTQQQNFIAHSRKILESNLFEESIMELVFIRNQNPPVPNYEKVIDPVFLDCVQLYTYLCNDLPQKLGELIDSGIVLSILHSLERRIPIQQNLLNIVIKFLDMLNLNSKGTEALLESKVIEVFFDLPLDHRSHKMIVMTHGSNHMFDSRQLLNQFANKNQQISDRIYTKCLQNIDCCQKKSWQLSQDYFEMEKQIRDLQSEEQKAFYKEPYGKKQINFEQQLESSVALLSYTCMDELEYLEDLKTHETNVGKTIKSQNVNELLYKVMRTPIICSAADNFIYHFQEITTLISMIQDGIDGFKQYLTFLESSLEQSFNDLFTILKTNNLDSLQSIPKDLAYADLSEPFASQDQRDSLKNLKQEDVVWVAICKTHILVEMLIILGTLSKFHERLGILPLYQELIDKIIQKDLGGYSSIIQLKNLLTRYYSSEYVNTITAQISRKDNLIEKYRLRLENDYSWENFLESDEPYSEFEDARNLYWRFEKNSSESLINRFANEVTKQSFEFVLPESIGVIQTFKCYKKIETFFSQIHLIYNKKKMHLKDKYTPAYVNFNQRNAKSVGNYLKNVADQCNTENLDIQRVMTISLMIERILPNLTKHLNYKWRNQVNGIFLLGLFEQENVIEVLGKILNWTVNQYLLFEQESQKKSMFLAKNIQIIVRDVVLFYLTCLKILYLSNGNLQTFLIYFRQDLTNELSQDQASNLFPQCVELTKNILYLKVFLPICDIMFGRDNFLLQNWNKFSIAILDNVGRIYLNLCSGGFKDPIDFFSQKNLTREQRQVRPDRRGWNPLRQFQRAHANLMNSINGVAFQETVDPLLLSQLSSMGFERNPSESALLHYHNDFEQALDGLIRGEFPADAAPSMQIDSNQGQDVENLVQATIQSAVGDAIITPGEGVEKQETQIIDTTNLLRFGLDTSIQDSEQINLRMYKLIEDTFIPMVSKHLWQIQISQRRLLLDKLFTQYREIKDKDKFEKEHANFVSDNRQRHFEDLLASLMHKLEAPNQEIPDWLVSCFIIRLMSFSKDEFLQNKNLRNIIFNISARFKIQVAGLGDMLAQKVKLDTTNAIQAKVVPDYIGEEIVTNTNAKLFGLHLSISLLYILVTDFINQQDVDGIKKLLHNTETQDEKSAFEEPVVYKDVEMLRKEINQFDSINFKEPINLITDRDSKTELVKQCFESIISLFKNLQRIEYSLSFKARQPLQNMLTPCLKLLRQISNYQSEGFDFRQLFMQSECLKLLFEIKIVDSDWQARNNFWERDKSQDQTIKDILENVWNSSKDLQKWYETLIKRQLFYQFKANYKRHSDLGTISKEQSDYLISGVDQQQVVKPNEQQLPEGFQSKPQRAQVKQKDSPYPITGSKKNIKSQMNKNDKKAKSNDDILNQDENEPAVDMQTKAGVNKLVKKFEELNEFKFSDFIDYYNSEIFGHQIQSFDVFLAACAKVCYLKKVIKPPKDNKTNEENKEQDYEMKIIIKRQVLKEILTDPDFNYGLPQKPLQKPDYKGDIPRCVTEVTNQLLEIFINQTKGYQMEIIKLLGKSNGPSAVDQENFIKLEDKLRMNPQSKIERKIYFLDQFQVLKLLTFIITRKNSITGLILKHNDSKTVKFIFRNIYLLSQLNIEGDGTRLIQLLKHKDNMTFASSDRLLTVLNFFTHLLLVNFGSTRNEKAIKKELASVFTRQIVKGITFKPQIDSVWSRSAGLLQNFSQIWLVSKFLTMREKEDRFTTDALAAINQKKFRFWKIQRAHLVKQIIIQCNSAQTQNDPEQPRFCLLENIQNFCQALQTPDLYFFDSNRNQCLSTSINVITKILRLFENSQSLGRILKVLGPKPADYNPFTDQSEDAKMEDSDDYDSQEDPDVDSETPSEGGDESGSSSDDDNDDMGEPLNAMELAELVEMQDESFESEMEEEDWSEDEESIEEELEELSEYSLTNQNQGLELVARNDQQTIEIKAGPRSRSRSEDSWPSGSPRRSREGNGDDDSEEAEENSWMANEDQNNEQISFNEESDQEDQMDEDDAGYSDEEENVTYEEDSQGLHSYNSNEESELDQMQNGNFHLRQRRIGRTDFVFRHQHQMDLQQPFGYNPFGDLLRQDINLHDYFDLDEQIGGQQIRDRLMMHQSAILPDGRRNPMHFANSLSPLQDPANLNSHSLLHSPLQIKDTGNLSDFFNAIQQRRSGIQIFKSLVKRTEGVFMLYITTVQQLQQVQQVFVPNDQSKNQSSKHSMTAESSDLHIQNPDDFKDHIGTSKKLQLPPQTRSSAIQRGNSIAQSNNPLLIEGMDPLFMESLSAVGLQNIADSHQIHAQISNQSNQFLAPGSIQMDLFRDLTNYLTHCSPQRRADILRQIQTDICRDLPSEIFAEARQLYRQNREELLRMFLNQTQSNRQQIQHQLMHNLLEQDQTWQRIDAMRNLREPTNPQSGRDPQSSRIRPEEIMNRDRLASQDSASISIDLQGPVEQSQLPIASKNLTSSHKDVTIHGTQFIQNFFIILNDLNSRLEKDQFIVAVEKQSEQILSHALIPQVQETALAQFQKIKGTVQTALIAFMNLNLDSDTKLTQSIKILHRIPNLRICLILSVLNEARNELNGAQEFAAKIKQENSKQSYYVCKQFFQDTSGLIRQLTLSDIVLGALVTIAQLQTTIEDQNQTEKNEVLDIVWALNKDQNIQEFAGFIGKFQVKKSVIEILLDIMLEYFELILQCPWILPERDLKITIETEFQIHVVNQFTQLLKPVIKAIKNQDQKQDFTLPVKLICELLVNRSLLLHKKSMDQVCETINDLANLQNEQVVSDYLKDRLCTKLDSTIQLLKDSNRKGSQAETIRSKIQQINELFTIAQGIQRIKDFSICEDKLLMEVFDVATTLIKEEDQRAIKNQQKSGKRAAYVFKDEIKELLVLIFSLCEYNLRIIFSNKTNVKEAQKSKDQKVAEKETEVQIQTLDKKTWEMKSENQKQQSIENLLESHISQSSPDYWRFKKLISFFIDNRRLINNFIQINSNVVNKELLRLALMIPQILDFDTKRIIWKIEIKRHQIKYKNESFQFQVRRDQTLPDSYAMLNGLSQKQWRGKMAVEFQGEDGIDGGGLFKEWLSNLSKDIFNEDMALFIKSAQGATYYPNIKSTVQPNYVQMFNFIGKVFGKALWDFQLLDCYFVKAFYKIMLGIPLSYSDLEDYDQELFKSLSWILNNKDVDMLSSYFVETVEYFGEQKEIELCEGGKDKLVTDENKWEYVQLVTNYRLYKAISTQIDSFLKGLYTVIPKDLLKLFDNSELELLISGLQNIDIDDLRENTVYENYTAQSKPVQFLFEALQELDNSERAEFIRFVTGSSKVPIEGFKGLRGQNGIQKFTVVRIPGSLQTRLPQSHTCHNQLDLPEYKDKETTKRMLLMAIKEGKTFGLA